MVFLGTFLTILLIVFIFLILYVFSEVDISEVDITGPKEPEIPYKFPKCPPEERCEIDYRNLMIRVNEYKENGCNCIDLYQIGESAYSYPYKYAPYGLSNELLREKLFKEGYILAVCKIKHSKCEPEETWVTIFWN